MGRAPCCEKIGLKRGSWSEEEDEILISYVQNHGHPNWRALPKSAGLLRCGKSCRLRWNNYLRPDIKRGNFTKQEEDTIVHLHQTLGNRWSIIAAKLPGRTDNEIKNVWHTHLKKRAEKHDSKCFEESNVSQCLVEQEHKSLNKKRFSNIQPSSSESSSSMTNSTSIITNHEEINHETFLDDSFWLESLSVDGENTMESIVDELPTTSLPLFKNKMGSSMDEMYLWYDMFTSFEETQELPEF